MLFRNRHRDRSAIEYHYDVSNEFYRLFLGPTMAYTCAYYRSPDMTLDEAQEAKLDLVCRKLRLQPGERLLDLGCGWGSFVVWAAKHYGVEALGVTLSPRQAAWAEEWIRREGLERLCRVECRDYRDVRGRAEWDKIASIGMIEHVGVRNYPQYFAQVRELLKPDGLFLNHGITHERHWRYTDESEFIEKYVFPNGELDNVSHIQNVMEDHHWEILDVERLRPHYARTCRHWTERLQARHDEARRYVDERTYRIWLAYLAGSSVSFARGTIGLYQILLSRDDADLEAIPETREDVYERADPLPSRHRAAS